MPRPPRCVRDYEIQIEENGAWKTIHKEEGNYQRWRVHAIGKQKARKLRLMVLRTYGHSSARLYEMRSTMSPREFSR